VYPAGSGSWPSDYAGAQNATFTLPTGPFKKSEEKIEPTPDIIRAEAELRPNEIQDLSDQLAELKKLAGALPLKFWVRIELDGQGSAPSASTVNGVNELLRKISDRLALK
jgi:hypothetical protein